ncbi:efflux RND transporter periplasmic adaptor subunit [Cohaesibacter celericrescens]|uniref:Efflux RND transporter periplasmic adaptor subunit n=1 Tax=Cohaesibacter celericrescens TaxID=2067669 RepID=A0A2N5XPX1_9HYPH|nr:efflux RND transporter periplasmic adaptor subunit [Cohaesibacter celericrescens]PLW76534.1 hypothetical protein C0081_14220 [Cohaesibacter celericrescens]
MKNHQSTALFLLITLALASCSQETETQKETVIRPVKVITVASEQVAEEKGYPAIVLPSQQVELSFRTAGQVIELSAKASASVKKYDVIAKLDTRDLETKISGLESQLLQAQAQLSALTSGARKEDIASLNANVVASEAQMEVARNQWERSLNLFKKGIIAKAKLDQDKGQYDVAAAQLEAVKQELIKGKSGGRQEDVAAQQAVIGGIEANLKSAKDNLSDATLRAPFDGIVARREVDNFANIQAKQTIAILQRLSKLELSFDVPGPDVAKIDTNATPAISVKLDSIEDVTFKANLVEFNTQANSATQTFSGRVSIEQPDGAIVLPGMTGIVVLTQPHGTSSKLSIPGTALAVEPSGEKYVWIVSNDTVKKQLVSVGKAMGSLLEITDGLSGGEQVVTAGVSFLQNGMKVRVTAGKE